MNSSGFLFDEHVPSAIVAFLRQSNPEIPVYIIGQAPAPRKGVLDPDILNWIEANNCYLITNNRASMPVHLQDHLVLGKHVPGIIQLPRTIHMTSLIEDLILLWSVSVPDEFRDQIVYLPL
jgi:hypothetical protein